ncbi:podocalyxin [Xenopus laevis]|uniref:Podocalyxin n=1 Tax=Xenopus laevis TaxID=8355 RepID=A0A8J0URN0_XENLA|nr:podocalyxin [Xenopus laevis]
MAKLNLLLGILWAVGCSTLSMAQQSTVSVATSTPDNSVTTALISDKATASTMKPTTATVAAVSTTPANIASSSVTTTTSSSETSASVSNTPNPVSASVTPANTAKGTTTGKTDSAMMSSAAPSAQPSLKPTATSPAGNSVSSQETSKITATTIKQEQSSPAEPTSTAAQQSTTIQAQETAPTNRSTIYSSFTSPTSLPTTNATSKMAASANSTIESLTTSLPTGSVNGTPAVDANTTFLTTTFQTSTKTSVTKMNIKVICQKKVFDNTNLKLKTNVSRSCNSDIIKDQYEDLQKMCKAVRPVMESTEQCNIVLGYNDKWIDRVEVLDVAVETRLTQNALHEALKNLTDEGGKSLFLTNKIETIDEDWLSMPLIITIVCLAVSLLLIAAIYGCWHQRQTHKREQRLTEELQTMENGYHDNPTLEVMETAPEMQEKKGGLNGELGDSWIVPLDNLREDLEEEEDTHL